MRSSQFALPAPFFFVAASCGFGLPAPAAARHDPQAP